MKTVEQAFAERQALIQMIHDQVLGTLQKFCSDRSFLLVSRRKDVNSLRDKIETGRYKSIDNVDDVVAFSIVIDITPQEKDVINFLKKVFTIEAVKGETTLQDERTFDFDCTRIYCRIKSNPGLNTPLSNMVFEVQVRTILQHAWSKITHPLVYKAKMFDARESRLASELMAHLEAADRTLARFKAISKTVKRVSRRSMEAHVKIMQAIDTLVKNGTIPSELRPENGRRLAENIYNSIEETGKNLDKAISKIISLMSSFGDAFPRSVSLFQLSIIALHQNNLLRRGGKSRYYYVTEDMITLFPEAASIPNQVAIR